MINTRNIQQAKNLITSSQKPIIVRAQDTQFNRKLLEYGKFDILLSIDAVEDKDKLRRSGSGLNHVLAKIAAKNNVAIGIDLAALRSLEPKKKARRLARIKQNIEVCRKAKCHLALINANDEKDGKALLQSLGASSQQVKSAI